MRNVPCASCIKILMLGKMHLSVIQAIFQFIQPVTSRLLIRMRCHCASVEQDHPWYFMHIQIKIPSWVCRYQVQRWCNGIWHQIWLFYRALSEGVRLIKVWRQSNVSKCSGGKEARGKNSLSSTPTNLTFLSYSCGERCLFRVSFKAVI